MIFVIYTVIYPLLLQFSRINKQMIGQVREQLAFNQKNVHNLRGLIDDVLETLQQNEATEKAERITSFIKPAIQAITNTEQEVETTQEAFDQISREIQISIEAFTEIVTGMQELASGSDEILRVSTNLNTLSASVRENTNDIDTVKKEANTNISSVAVDSKEIERWLRSIADGMDTINQSMTSLQALSASLRDSSQKTRAVIDGITF